MKRKFYPWSDYMIEKRLGEEHYDEHNKLVDSHDKLLEVAETLLAIESQPPENRAAVLLLTIEKAMGAIDNVKKL